MRKAVLSNWRRYVRFIRFMRAGCGDAWLVEATKITGGADLKLR